MKKNVGKTDKMIRWVIGLLIIAAGVYYQSWWGVLGLIPIITAGMGFCWLYTLLGMNTDKK